MAEILEMSSQFKGLPMGDLIGGPLSAACDAQIRMAIATSDFIKNIGFMPGENPGDPQVTRVAKFEFMRQIPALSGGSQGVGTGQEKVTLDVPLLAIVKIPSLSITRVNITFDMEVKSSFSAKESDDKSLNVGVDGGGSFGAFSLKVHVEGSVASHKENTRSSDNSAKYHVEIQAEDGGMPEGLSRVLDIMNSAITPKVTPVEK